MKKKVLIIDDEAGEANAIERAIDPKAFDVFVVVAAQPALLAQEASAILEQYSTPEDPFQFLILDIKIGKATLGGIEVFETLLARGLAPRWRHVFVLSVWLEHVDEYNETQVREFVARHGIPEENLLPKLVARRERMLERIGELLQNSG